MNALRAKVLVLLCVAACLCLMPGCKDQTKWVRKLGFTPLSPPTQFLSPGAIVMRRHHLGKAQLLCSAEESLGPNFKPSNSRTIGGRYRKNKKIGWHLSGDALQQVKVAASSDEIADVFVQIDNAKVLAATDTDVLLAVHNRSAACEAAIKRRQAEGWDVSLISRALVADVSYSVLFKNESTMDASAKLAQLNAVSVTLGGNFQSMTSNSAQAKKLVWGFVDDQFLGAITRLDRDVEALRGQSPVPSKRASIFLPEETLVAPTADKAAQTDEDATPAWGVTADESAASPVPGMDDAMNDALSDDNSADTPGFVPQRNTPADTPIDDGEAQNPSKPISPRSRRLPGDVLGTPPQG